MGTGGHHQFLFGLVANIPGRIRVAVYVRLALTSGQSMGDGPLCMGFQEPLESVSEPRAIL